MGYKHDIQDILAVGSELFRKKGYHNVGINEILKQGGLPKGSFYNFFESKEAFAIRVVEYYGRQSLDRIKSYLRNRELSPLERLKSFYRMTIDANVLDGLDAGCLVNNISTEVAGLNEKLARGANEAFAGWVEEIARCVEEGQKQGEIRDDFSSGAIAEYLHAGSYGAFSRMKATRSQEFLELWFRMTFDFIQA